MNFNLKQLEAFVWVCDLGSFRKAANRLNTTQPNISSRISALENALDIKLMERDAGSVRLTSKGRVMLEQARVVLRASDQFIAAANNDALIDGVLKLGVTEMVVHTWLREFLKELKERHPNISVELTVDLSANLEKELSDRAIDLAFHNAPFVQQSTGSHDLGVYPMIWIASPSSDLASLKTVSLKQLAQYPVLTHARGTQPYQEVAAHFVEQRQHPVRLVPSNNLAACIHMSIDGMGTSAVPEAMVVDEINSGLLCRVNYQWRPQSLCFFARYDAEKSGQFVVRAAEIGSEVAGQFVDKF